MDLRGWRSGICMVDADHTFLFLLLLRAREKLTDKRNRCIEEIIKLDPEYKPPADYKPRKFWRKVYIPINEYPGYNFIGLIIGPRGNTQKRMQKETNCKIAIRGKGSVKEGASKDPKYDYGEDEELHVLVTGETQEDVSGGGGGGGSANRAVASRAAIAWSAAATTAARTQIEQSLRK